MKKIFAIIKSFFNKIFSLPGKGVNFFREVLFELKKVEFPSRSTTISLSILIIVSSIVSGILLYLADSLLVAIRTTLIKS